MNNEAPLEKMKREQHEHWKEQNDAFQERMRQDEQMRTNLEQERISKLKAAGLSEDAYAVREIVLMQRRAPDVDFYQPSLHQLGFANTIDSMVQAHRFLQELQRKGCFREVERSTSAVFTIKDPNTRLLKKELRKLKLIEQSWMEKFLRGVSHGLVGVNHVLTTVSLALSIIVVIQSIQISNLNTKQDLSNDQAQDISRQE